MINFPLSSAFAAFQKLGYIMFSFSFISHVGILCNILQIPGALFIFPYSFPPSALYWIISIVLSTSSLVLCSAFVKLLLSLSSDFFILGIILFSSCECAKLLQLCLTLCSLMDHSWGSSILGILQARILEWVDMLSSRRSSWPRYLYCISYVSCIVRQVL